ncbi:hypothetical protein CHS0354_031927 [Potamilus streckersoni]|uniref:LNR domain-containing protein n=1 Tax=Potamilus streckersoni TaxID=2493646 RepID=A0AAE0VKS8_9BIVA|nr:hypothetical protein CHS0354_031927 [Potamilus streckersoni]
MENNLRKVIQKRVYDVISHKYGVLIVMCGVIAVTVSCIHFGETMVEWSTEKYAAVFNSFSDNIVGRSFRERLCLPVPIDVVYTWVNGSDPEMLIQLKRVKMEMEEELNTSRIHRNSKGETVCVFSNCLVTNIVLIDPMLPSNMTVSDLETYMPVFSDAKKIFKVTAPLGTANMTAVAFSNETYVEAVLNSTVWIAGMKRTLRRGYITSDWTIQNSMMLPDLILMSGFPYNLTGDELKAKLPEKHRKGIEAIQVFSEKGVAVVLAPNREDFLYILDHTNFTIDGKEPTLNAANLVWDLRDFSRDEDISASRFEDNDELRYSLRSIEKNAPWVRHIYIVTNGQIPYWLNLENPRVTIVTHEEIFVNKSHLPTFSSPAIEGHIHQIPGLSDKFIYMNDDVMFGREVWPDDFFSYSTGQKVYLTWPVPNCQEGCPSTWIRDGYCDKACNNSECEWDGGDCNGTSAQHGAGPWHGVGGWRSDQTGYCHSGCANNWMADRYCDTSCNVRQCGFDAGDCGVINFNQLYQIELLENQTSYTLPRGETVGFFNMTNFMTTFGAIDTAEQDENKVIRAVAIAKKFKVMTFVIHSGHNETRIYFQLNGKKENVTNVKKQMNFTLMVDTSVKIEPIDYSHGKNDTDSKSTATNKTSAGNKTEEYDLNTVKFEDISSDKQSPHIVFRQIEIPVAEKPMPSNLTILPLPVYLMHELDELNKEFKEGEITDLGYQQSLQLLWIKFLNSPKEDHVNASSLLKKPASYRLSPSRVAKDGKGKVGHLFHKVGGAPPLNKTGGFRRKQNLTNANLNAPRRHLLTINEEQDSFDDGVEGLPYSMFDMNKINTETGAFPWEKGMFADLQKKKEKLDQQESYVVGSHQGRRLLDTFGDSLRHVNRLYNKAFGYHARKVPAHMPHMIDKNIMAEMLERFPEEWAATSSHKVRSSTDMQYAFSYFYYMMGVREEITVEMFFDEIDTDKSSILSDREIRTLATRLYDLPLDLQTLTKIEQTFINCSRQLPAELINQSAVLEQEVYYEKDMPQVTRNLFIHCDQMVQIVRSNFKAKQKYKYTELDDTEVTFKMIKTNISSVVGQLDDVRKHPKKFICLNDNIDHGHEQAKTVKAILQDFYESFFPIQSQFELPRDYRNRFLHVNELREWRNYRDWLKFWTQVALSMLVLFTIASFFADKIEAAQRRFGRRRINVSNPTNNSDTNESSSTPFKMSIESV